MTRFIIMIIGVVALTSCSVFDKQTRQYNRQIKNQEIPVQIVNSKWILLEATNDNSPCYFRLWFKEKGQMEMRFKENTFEGTYLIDSTKFKNLFCGWISKIVWTTDPECTLNPSKISLYINGENMKYSINSAKIMCIEQNKIVDNSYKGVVSILK